MTDLKKKFIAGILSGALIFTGGFAIHSAQAADNSANQQQKFEKHQRGGNFKMTDEQRSQRIKEFADYYGVNQSEVEAALKNHVHFEDLKTAAVLSKLSGKSFSEVLAMKTDWRQVAEKLGVSREQFENYKKNEMLEGLAKFSKLDKKTVESLLKDNYSPHDITFAGLIANESGKNVKSILAKKKINNDWEDVAKEFNVDLSKFKKDRGNGHGFGRGPAPDDEEDFDD